jgi:hypothetical protein
MNGLLLLKLDNHFPSLGDVLGETVIMEVSRMQSGQ